MLFEVQNQAGIEIEWVKFELGETATPFEMPDYTTELLKCQRYFKRIYLSDILVTGGDGRYESVVSLRHYTGAVMRTKLLLPTIFRLIMLLL